MKNTRIRSSRLSTPRRIAPLACSFAILLAVAGLLIIWPSAVTQSSAMRSALNALTLEPAIAVQSQTSTFYLRGTGPVDNPPTLFLNATAPTATTEKFKDSPGITSSGGNLWKEVGTWTAAPAMTAAPLVSLSDLHVWLGLKNSDDQGTYFDLRIEAYKNSTLVTSGQSLCITGVTRNPVNAKEVIVGFDPFSAATFDGTSDVLKLKILTRVGTNADGGSCGGHSSAVGLRLYFDAVARASRFNATQGASDTTPPALTVAQPANNSITNATQINVTGTFSDQSQTVIVVNGVAAALQGNSFSATVPLSEGPNSLLITATDAAGNRTDITRSVIRDTTPPAITIQQPTADIVTNNTQVAVSGTFNDATATTIKVNNVDATLTGNTFSAIVPLAEGVNALNVIALDAGGNQNTASRNITRDTTAPAVSIQQPAEGSVTNATQVTVTGTFSDEGQTTITVNGITGAVQGNTFTASVPVAEGQNTLLAVATDAVGNRTEVQRTVTRDTTAPSLTVEEPADFSYTNANAVQISGTFTEAISITVNGATPVINGNNFKATVQLTNEGVNTITVRAVDGAGNQSELFHTVNCDTTLPIISLTSPSEGEIARVLLTRGSVTDASPVTITVDGVQRPVEDGFFERQIEVAEGARQVRVIATDAAGNHNEVVRSVIIDTTSPIFSNINPAEGTIANSPATITGRVTDTAAVTVKVNDVAAVVSANGDFHAENVPLLEGENQLLLTAIDAAGNQNDFSLTLIGQDRTPPGALLLFPVISPTRLTTSTVEGRAEAGSLIVISGGIAPVTAHAAFGSGLFTANVNLNVGTNNLSIIATDAAGNASPTAQVSITSDPNMALPPAGQPKQINISTGNAQKGLVSTALPRPLIAIVTDRAGNPVANVTVRFTSQVGGGRFTVGNSDFVEVGTDAQGYASATYIAGPTAGLQQIHVNFPGNTITPAIFLAEALEPSGTETSVSGTVLDQNLRALPNVLVRIGGQQTRTGSNGRFKVSNVATGPHQLLELIGRDQITLPGRWPNITHDFDVLPGVDNELGRPLFLPKVNDGVTMPLDANGVVTHDTTVELPVVGGEPPIRVTVKTGTRVIFPPDVTDKRLSVTRIATNRVPMALEDGRATNLYISVQPSGAVFETPLEISFPNLDSLPANSEVLLMSFDHDAGRYVKVGTGHVTADGREVKSDAGNGIHVGAWQALPPPPPKPEVTVLAHIQIVGNPLFENKTITKLDAWLDGERAVPMPNPALGSIENAYRVDLKVTKALADGAAPIERIESDVVAETKLKIKIDSFDSRFAPSVERFNFKYTITAPETTPPTIAKLEVFKAGDLNNPIYLDSALPLTAEKLEYSQSGMVGWDGKMNQGTGNNKYIEPKDGPFTIRLSVATKPDLSDLVKSEDKTVKVEIESMTLTPDNDFKSFKPNLTATEVDSPIELTVRVKNKAGNGVVTAIPFKIKWSFDDPDDTADDPIIDPNHGTPDDNIEVQFGGKAANTGGVPGAARIVWKTVSGFTATVSPDGQAVDAEVSTSGTDQGKSKLTFSTSVIGGDNYHLIAKYLKDDGTTVVKEKKSGKWSVWKKLDFQHAFRMNGGMDLDVVISRDIVNPAFNGDGYTDYKLGKVAKLQSGAQSPEFIAQVLPPLPVEKPSPTDTQQQIDDKAKAWFDRNGVEMAQQVHNYVTLIAAPPFSVIGARYLHPKVDNNPSTGKTNYYPPATRINIADPAHPVMLDPDGEWALFGIPGATQDERALVFLNALPEHYIVIGRHEIGHASDHVLFDYPANPPTDHATSGLMKFNADPTPRNPFGDPNFSPDSIRKLRGIKP